MSALGEEFRSAREARGLTLSDVAEQIHIRSVYLNAIEHDDWSSIGAPVYVRGFIRTYARFLGLDGENAVARFNQSLPPERPAPSQPIVQTLERERFGPSPWAVGGILVAFLLVVFVGYEWWSYARTAGGTPSAKRPVTRAAAPAVKPTSAAAVSQAPATPAPTPPPRHQLAIRLTEPSWLRVTVDGATRAEGVYPAGTRQTYTGNVAVVRVGNAGGVTISVNGKPEPALGKSGDVVEQRYSL